MLLPSWDSFPLGVIHESITEMIPIFGPRIGLVSRGQLGGSICLGEVSGLLLWCWIWRCLLEGWAHLCPLWGFGMIIRAWFMGDFIGY